MNRLLGLVILYMLAVATGGAIAAGEFWWTLAIVIAEVLHIGTIMRGTYDD